jgi:murein DD-endopeptidase MepM/ murein hydrolase activator NlpD
MSKVTEYIKDQLEVGDLKPEHIQALTLYFQMAHITQGGRDGMPGPSVRATLEKRYPEIFRPEPPPIEDIQPFLACPLPLLKRPSFAQVRVPYVTSAFRPADRPDHDGIDLFYRWEPGDKPDFVGDGGCEGRLANGMPKWVVPYGTFAQAAAPGTIQLAGPSPTGYRVWVNHHNGLRSGYFHLSTCVVKPGDEVLVGTALGLVGHNPSPAVDGNHLHFEVSPVSKYQPLNPMKYLLPGAVLRP